MDRMKRGIKLTKKRGIWVAKSGNRLTRTTVEKTVRKVRKERESQILGKRSEEAISPILYRIHADL